MIMRIFRLVQASVLLAGLAALPLFAQTSADPNRGTGATGTGTGAGDTPTTTNTRQDVDRDRDHNYGLVGLLGLAGLAGLMRRGHHHGDSRVNDTPTGKNRA